MKGLLIKDVRFLWQQKKLLLAVLVLGTFLYYERFPAQIVAYLTFVYAFVAINSLGYDEAENGYAFLFTLPVRRREYVVAKYIFAFIILCAAAMVGSLIAMASYMGRGEMSACADGLAEPLLLGVPAVVVFLALLIPVQIKYGAETSRIIMLAALGVIMAGGYAGLKYVLNYTLKHDIDLDEIMDNLLTKNMPVLGSCVWLASLAVFGISCLVSIAFMKKKEF